MILILNIVEPIVGDPARVTSWLDLIMKGGIIMIPIVLLSFISVYLFIERFYIY